MIDDPEFYAWLDGELAEPAAGAMAARVAADPALAAQAAEHRAMADRLKQAFAPVVEAPLPTALRAALEPPSAGIVDLAARRHARIGQNARPPTPRPRWSVTGLAVAASLALGLGIGAVLPRGSADSASYASESGALVASGPLAAALDRQLASAGEKDNVRLALTFRDQEGRWCRSFSEGATSGLACRDGERWHVQGLVAGGSAAPGDYRMAAGQDPALLALIDARRAGDPVDESGELRARDSGWR